MGFLSGMLSPLLTATSQAVGGQQQGDIQGFLQKRKMDEETAAAALKTRLADAQMGNINSEILKRQQPSVHFDPNSGRLINETAGTSAPVEGVNPADKVGDAVKIATATKAIPTYGDLHPHPDQALVQTQGEDGQVVYTPRDKAAGMQVPGKSKGGGIANLPAPMAAKVGQAGEMIKKLAQLLPQMDAIDVNVGNSAGEDIAENGIGAFGVHIPGTKGIGNMMVNRSPEYAKYEASFSPFELAAAHALSGARINTDQLMSIRRANKYGAGDAKPTKAQKRRNIIDLTNSIVGSLPADAMAAQEDQMDPAELAMLKVAGYRGAARKGAAPATQHATTGASDPGGDITLGTDPTAGMSDADAWEHWKESGLTAAQATAKVKERKK